MTVKLYHSFKDLPRFTYNPDHDMFMAANDKASVFANADRKIAAFRERFLTVQQQLFKDERFRNGAESDRSISLPPITMPGEMIPKERSLKHVSLIPPLHANDRFVITPVESLPGNPGIKFSYGFLTRLEEARISLEGLTLSVPLDLQNARMPSEFICEGCLVLVKGVMDDTVFRVSEVVLPPESNRELCDLTRNFFAGDKETLEPVTSEECTSIVLSDFYLDDRLVMAKFEEMLKGFDSAQFFPELIVLMGSFTREAPGLNGDACKRYQELFASFSDVLKLYTNVLKYSKILMIPGPNDPGPACLPRFGLDGYRTHGITRDHPNVSLGTNPCRVRLAGREVVFVRAGLTDALRRHRLVGAQEKLSVERANKMTAAAVLSQMHLLPVQTTDTSVMWDFDNALRLYPIPHAIFVGQGAESAETIHAGCHFVTVGSFSTEHAFYCYRPCGGSTVHADEVELSMVDPPSDVEEDEAR